MEKATTEKFWNDTSIPDFPELGTRKTSKKLPVSEQYPQRPTEWGGGRVILMVGIPDFQVMGMREDVKK